MTARASRVVLISSFVLISARASAQESAVQPPAAAPEAAEAAEPALPPPPAPPTPDAAAPAPDAAPAPAAPAPEAATTGVVPTAGVELLSEDELNSLGLDQAEPTVDLGLKVSGFADFGFGLLFAPENSFWRASGTAPARPTFYVGNLNVYLAKRLTKTLNTMAEVRFTYLPNGSGAFGFEKPTSTTTFDYTDFGRPTRWGSIIIQRVYVEWQPSSLFAIRGGQFLSPYGVWNVDHGSPVVIPFRRPWIIGVGWIPEKQTGLELFGRARLSSDNELGYHLTLSNGVGPISEYADMDNNKAIGGRVYWGFYGLGRLRVGASGYFGRVTDAMFRVAISGQTPTADEVITTQFDSLTWATDLTWDLDALHVQTEWMFNQQAYTKKGRAVITGIGNMMFVPSDLFSWGGYGLIGYRLPWFGIMPFVLCERINGDLSGSEVKLTTYQFGLNIRPVDELVLKIEFNHVDQDATILPSINQLMTQAAWAF
jgi:hypothetical protein